jgi:hypothetical protein
MGISSSEFDSSRGRKVKWLDGNKQRGKEVKARLLLNKRQFFFM